MSGTTWSLIHATSNIFNGWSVVGVGVFSLGSGVVSLIEKLGGYEKAKAEFEALKKHPELYSGEFEQIPEIKERIERSKMKLQENGYYWSPEWDSQSCADQDFVNNFKKGWLYQQSKIEQLEKELAQMKHINDEQNKNLETAFKTIQIQQKFDADSQGAIACLTEMNGRLEKEKAEITRLVQSLRNEFDLNSDCPQVERQIELLEKALRGES